MKKVFTILLAALTMTAFVGCSKDNDEKKPENNEYTGTPRIILDTDIGSSTDDLFSLKMLYRYQEEGRCQLLGVVVDREGEDCAACADVMNTFFGHGDIPIGLERNGIKKPRVYIDYRHLRDLKDEDGKPLFATTISDYSALPEGWKLYRQLLAGQPDHSVSICSIGFVTTLAHLLESQADAFSPLSGVELIRQKVKCLYIMGGVFTSSEEPEYNFAQGPDFAKTFFNLWPKDVDIVFSPMEVGNGINYLKALVLSDLSGTDRHPLKYIYETLYDDAGGQKMWDPLTVIQAVEGDALFSLSERGTVTITDDAATIFTPSATGNCRHQLAGSAEWNSQMLQKIRATMP